MRLWKVFYRLAPFASLSCDTAHLDRDRSAALNGPSELYIIAFSLEQTDPAAQFILLHDTTVRAPQGHAVTSRTH